MAFLLSETKAHLFTIQQRKSQNSPSLHGISLCHISRQRILLRAVTPTCPQIPTPISFLLTKLQCFFLHLFLPLFLRPSFILFFLFDPFFLPFFVALVFSFLLSFLLPCCLSFHTTMSLKLLIQLFHTSISYQDTHSDYGHPFLAVKRNPCFK